MKRVFLQNNNGFTWISSGNCFVKGYLFDKTGKFYSEDKLPGYFENISSFTDFEERIRYANGSFVVVIKFDEDFFVASDKIRSFPLYYSRYEGKWIVSDNPFYLIEKTNLRDENILGIIEFNATGYVTGSETLVENIRQVQAGEIIHLKKDDLFAKFYYTYRISVALDNEYQDMQRAGCKVVENSFKRLFQGLAGKTAVIPLSGGYDSRLIAAMAKINNYTDVVCFTYGREGNPEIEISQKVAEKLGLKWYFVKYDDELIKDYLKTDSFKDYFRFASGLTSMFFLQEYFAVKYLKDHRLIPPDSVFIPGHSGDFLGGSQLNKHGNFKEEEGDTSLMQRIFDIKYCLQKPDKKYLKKIEERIKKSIQEKYHGKPALAYSVHEDWDFKEKLAKFNFNSVSTYTFFGYEFRLPYWDNEMLDFFKYLPLHAKINKYLYDDILTNTIFEPLGLNFPRELQPSVKDLKKMKIRSRIKKHLPEEVKRVFKKENDILFYHEITRQMVKDLENRGEIVKIHGNSYNSIITQWYVFYLRQYLMELKRKKNDY